MATPGSAPGTVAGLLLAGAETAPDAVAIVVDGRASLTLGAWAERAAAGAAVLARRGLGPGDRVAVRCAPTGWIDYAVSALAVQWAGGVVVGLPADPAAGEVAVRIDRCGVTGVVLGDGVPAPAHARWTVHTDELRGGRPARGRPAAAGPDDLAEILHTSGTTGAPKAVAVTHANLTHGRGPRSRVVRGAASALCPVPLGTNAGHSALMLALTAPTTVHVLSRTGPDDVAAAVARSRIEMAVLPPRVLRRWAAGAADAHDLSSLTTLMLGSSLVPSASVRRLARLVPDAALVVGYGSTEAAPTFLRFTVPPGGEVPVDGPLPLRSGADDTGVRVVDAAGEPVPPGELGEICLRVPGPRRSYHADPAATAAVFLPAGWTRMGDLGRLDPDGTLHFFDRARHVVRTVAGPVSTSAIEETLQWCPGVVESAAFGLPAAGGDVPAVAVLLDGASQPPDIPGFLRDRLPPDGTAARVFVVDDLPRGPLGKVLKERLRDRFAAAEPGGTPSHTSIQDTRSM